MKVGSTVFEHKNKRHDSWHKTDLEKVCPIEQNLILTSFLLFHVSVSRRYFDLFKILKSGIFIYYTHHRHDLAVSLSVITFVALVIISGTLFLRHKNPEQVDALLSRWKHKNGPWLLKNA